MNFAKYNLIRFGNQIYFLLFFLLFRFQQYRHEVTKFAFKSSRELIFFF